ncbi:hypothetical protein ACFY8W_19545 [Streptomyces sp. NPDC012637]|uniref:hypothetical protein n=1 Tax=Streptomyces sp. NPDC012637 TaxID=3364842 RepID=UPI0036EAE86C
MSPAQLRGLGLGAAVLVAVLVPIAASAGPAGGPARGSTGSGSGTGDAGDAKGNGLIPELGLGPVRDSAAGTAPDAAPDAVPDAGPDAESDSGEPPSATRCGPELASPDGVEAQTCVVTEGADTWARTYYRNRTGQELDAVLTLMAPGGRTVQVRCAVEARDEPGTCETPREPVRGGVDAYTAVAEFAGAGEGGNTPLLLRSGSNVADPGGS